MVVQVVVKEEEKAEEEEEEEEKEEEETYNVHIIVTPSLHHGPGKIPNSGKFL